MNENKIISDIDNKISELGSLQTVVGTKTNRFDGFVALDKIDSKVASIKKTYNFLLGLSIVEGGLLYVAGWAHFFDLHFVTSSKVGLLIILAAGVIGLTIRNKKGLERLIMIKYLLELKSTIEQE